MAEFKVQATCDSEESENLKGSPKKCDEPLLNDEESLSKLVNEEGGLEVIVNKENYEVHFRSGDPSKEYEIKGVSDYKEYAEKKQQGDSECEESSSEYQESLSELVDDEEADEKDTSGAKDVESDFLRGEPPKQDKNENSFDDKVCAEERQEADGEENSLVNGVMAMDFDEDIRYPQYIPKKGNFFQHDVRKKEDAKQKEELSARDNKKKLWLDEVRWRHDRFCSEEQFPKSKEELIEIYGYDMRNKNGPPQARSQGKYGDQRKKLEFDEGKWGHDKFRSEEQFPKSKQELIKTYGYNMQNEDGHSQARSQNRNENWKASTTYGRGKFRGSRPQRIVASCNDRDGPREFRRGPSLQEQDRKAFNSDKSYGKVNTNEPGELMVNTAKEDSEVNYDISIINSKEFPALPTGFPICSNLRERNLQDWNVLPRRGKTAPFSNHHAKPGIRGPDARGTRGTSHGDHRRSGVNKSCISPTFLENKENHLITDIESVVLHQNVGSANDVYSNAFRQLENNDSEVDDIPIINSRELPTKESILEPETVEHQSFFQKCSLGSPESKFIRTLIFENSNLSGRNSVEQDIPSKGDKVAPISNHAEHGIRRPIARRPRGAGRKDCNGRAKVIMSHVSPTFFANEENHPTTNCENLALRKTVDCVNGVHSNAFRQLENNEYPSTICTPTESVSTPSIESQSTYIPPPINTSSSVYHTFQPATFNPYTESYAGYQPTLYSPAEYVVPTPSAQSQSTYISLSINPSPYQPFIPTIYNPNTSSYAEYQPSLYVPTEYVVPIPNAQNQSAFAASFNTSTYQSCMSTISNPDSNGYGKLYKRVTLGKVIDAVRSAVLMMTYERGIC